MATTNVVTQVLDTIMSIPGMNDMVKIDLKISRKNVLLLNNVIERGLSDNGTGSESVFGIIQETNLKELQMIGKEVLEKAGLVELSEKLHSLVSAK